MIDLNKKVGDLAAENPSALAVFEKLGIDYCCNGGQTFADASKSIGLTSAELFALIATSVCRPSDEPFADWTQQSLRELTAHIVNKHHAFTQGELARLPELIDKVVAVHRDSHPELLQLRELFRRLRDELPPHMDREEQILFPSITILEDATLHGRPMPAPPVGLLDDPIRVMMGEHETAADLLRQMRALTFEFHIPLDGCASYRSLMGGLIAFEQDFHLHVHLENNILFPRALAMEAQAGPPDVRALTTQV